MSNKKETIYPNWSVYVVYDGGLKIPYSSTRRVKLYDYFEAVKAAKNVYKTYNRRSKREVQVVIQQFDAPYEASIKAIISNPIDLYTGQ